MWRGPQVLPLSSFPVVGTRSLEEAHDAVTRTYLPHELTAAHDEVDMTLNAVADHHLTLGFLTHHAVTERVMPPTEDGVHVNLTTRDSTAAEGHTQADADEPLTPQELARVGCMRVRTLYASVHRTSAGRR